MSSILLQHPKNPKAGPNWRAKKGDLWDFLTSIVAKHQKIEGGSFGEFFPKKVSQCRKTKGGPFSLAQYCMLSFWFSSLGEIVQFDTLKLRRSLRTIMVSSRGLMKRRARMNRFHLFIANICKYNVYIMYIPGCNCCQLLLWSVEEEVAGVLVGDFCHVAQHVLLGDDAQQAAVVGHQQSAQPQLDEHVQHRVHRRLHSPVTGVD